MRVLPEKSNAGTVVQPAGLRFHSGPARQRHGHQEVIIYNVSGGAISFQARLASSTLGQTFAILPEAGVIRPETPFRMLILHSGDRAGSAVINLQLSDGIVVPIRSEFVPAPQPTSKQNSTRLAEGGGACGATKLVPAVVSLGQGSPAVGWPTAMVLDIKDDCGTAWANGSVVALFSNGDAPVELKSLDNGRWHGTWSPRAGVGKDVLVRFQAKDRNSSIEGAYEARTGLLGLQAPPVVGPAGVVSPIDPKPFEPLALGSLVRLDGERLAETPQTQRDGTTWTGQLGSTRVFIAGRMVALGSVSGNRIEGALPFDIEPNTPHQLIVLRGNTYSLPVTVDVARATPNLLSNVQAGDNWAAISIRSSPDQPFNLAGPENPPVPGDEVLLLAVGAVLNLRRENRALLYLTAFIAGSYLFMCNVKYGMNLRYTNMWDMPLRLLAVTQLGWFAARFPKRENVLFGALIAGLAVFDLHQYQVLFVNFDRDYEMITSNLLQAVKMLKFMPVD